MLVPCNGLPLSLLAGIIFLAAFNTLPTLAFRITADDVYQVKWNVEANTIVFEVTVATTGFVGLGFSPNGGMTGADIVVGGVRDGIPYLEDRHALGFFTPILDDVQNYELLDATENLTHTYLKFSRQLDTCDDKDVAITDDTINLIWSFGETDNFAYHGSNRGSKTVNLLDPVMPADPDLSEYSVWELRTNKVMPAEETTYWCTIHKTPNVSKMHHIVGFNAIVESPDAFVHTHHMEAYLCHVEEGMESVFDSYLGHPGDDCYYPQDENFPGKNCETIAYGWAIGGEVTLFPDYLGFPLVAGDYFKLEVHYNNPNKLSNVAFDTGLKLYYTDAIRQFDAGRLVIGSEINYTQMIPPESTKFTTVAHCDVSCLADMPPNGITAFNFLLHSHLSGRKMKVRHFRGGKELPWLIKDDNYDFNFQATRSFKTHRRLLPGDHLSLECEYDSTWNDGTAILGGRSTKEEMCMTFVSYYPRLDNLVSCNSEVPKKAMLGYFNIEEIELAHPSDTDPIVRNPIHMRGKRFSEIVNRAGWTPATRIDYQIMALYSNHTGYCRPTMKEVSTSYPFFDEDYQPIYPCSNPSN